MQKPEIAIASFVRKPKKDMVKGTTAPPPPIPPMDESVMRIMRTISPPNSIPSMGKMDLCSH